MRYISRFYIAAFSAAISLQACSGSQTEPEKKAASAPPAADTSFTAFFQKFASDSAFQLQHLAEDIKIVVIDQRMDNGSPKKIEKTIPYPLKFQNMTEEFIQNLDDRHQIHFERPKACRADFYLTVRGFDGGHRYKFRMRDERWELFEYRDDSDKFSILDEETLKLLNR